MRCFSFRHKKSNHCKHAVFQQMTDKIPNGNHGQRLEGNAVIPEEKGFSFGKTAGKDPGAAY